MCKACWVGARIWVGLVTGPIARILKEKKKKWILVKNSQFYGNIVPLIFLPHLSCRKLSIHEYCQYIAIFSSFVHMVVPIKKKIQKKLVLFEVSNIGRKSI